MTSYSITVYSLDSLTLTANGSTTTADQVYWAADGSSGQYYSDYSFDLSSGTSVTITDNDSSFDDDDVSWGPWSPAPDGQEQSLSADATIGSTTHSSGSFIEDEWEITLVDEDGNTYRLVGVSINDTLIGYTFDGAAPPEGVQLRYLDDGSETDYQSMVPCFTAGTMIATPDGERRIEDIRVGDLVLTADHNAQPVLWIGYHNWSRDAKKDAERMSPILLKAGALRDGIPNRDIRVSPQHRILLRSKIAERMTGQAEVFVAAKHLLVSTAE